MNIRSFNYPNLTYIFGKIESEKIGFYFSFCLHFIFLIFVIGFPDFFKSAPINIPTVIPIEIVNVTETTSILKNIDDSKKQETKIEQKTANKNKPALIQQHFQTTVSQTLIEEFKYTSKMQVPKIEKIVLNIGLGEALINSKALENATRDLSLISGQKPVSTKAKKSIATYKLREGQIIGVMVTLRKRRMYEFLERLIISALPRIRDFHGVPIGSFDGRGNYSLGVREQIIFPEIEYGSVDKMRGLQLSIVTSSNTNEESRRLLELLGMPFERKDNSRQVA